MIQAMPKLADVMMESITKRNLRRSKIAVLVVRLIKNRKNV